jgi:pimeloyl-ACP methyl ester carboxylesterase
VVFLHGWGGSTAGFAGAARTLSAYYQTVNLDFFGHGQSENVVYPSVAPYAEAVALLLARLELGSVCIVAHSFGARVALYLAARHPTLVRRMVLTGAAGVRPRRGLLYRLRVARYKRLKKRGKDVTAYGSADWRALPAEKRAAFSSLVNEDLTPLLRTVAAPTLLVWGEDDDAVPLRAARIMVRRLQNAALHVFPSGGHYAYIEYHTAFCAAIHYFFGGAA